MSDARAVETEVAHHVELQVKDSLILSVEVGLVILDVVITTSTMCLGGHVFLVFSNDFTVLFLFDF